MDNRIILLDEYLSQKRLDEEKYIYMLFFLLEEKINKIIQKIKLVEQLNGFFTIQSHQFEQLYNELNTLITTTQEKALQKLEVFLLNMLNDGANFAATNLRNLGYEEVEKVKITRTPQTKKEREDSMVFLPYLFATLMLCRQQIKEACDMVRDQFTVSVADALNVLNNHVAQGILQNTKMTEVKKVFKDQTLKQALTAKITRNQHKIKIGNYASNVVTANGMQLFNRASVIFLNRSNVTVVRHITQGDERVCKECKELHNTLWALDGEHPTIRSIDQHPGGVTCTLHAKCRCHFVPEERYAISARRRSSDGS